MHFLDRTPWDFVRATLRVMGSTIRTYLRVDRYLAALILLFLALFVPPIPRAADNPPMVAAFVDDEVWQALALDGTLAWPYGNPANFLDPTSRAYQKIPPYWEYFRYPELTYYGGAMYQLATPVYAFLRAIGLPPFPTVVIVLRTVTVLSALLSLIVLYNFASRYGTRVAAIMAVLFFMADGYFGWFTIHIHPDLLQVLFGLFALVLAIRHAERGDLPSLAALGIACGFVQGTKMGGVWMVPVAALAWWWGLRASGQKLTEIGATIKRLAVLGVASLVGLFVTTPYAFIGDYYYRKLVDAWRVQGAAAADGPFGVITMWSWVTALYQHFGPIAVVLSALAVARIGHGIITGRHNRAFTLAFVLCLSQFMVYGSGKYWVVVYYLLLTTALMAVLAFDALVALVRFAAQIGVGRSERRWRRLLVPRIAGAALLVAFIVFYVPYGLASVFQELDFQMNRASTQISLNTWFANHVPREKTIMFDNYAYFDPAVFSHVIRDSHPNWRTITGYDPDYLVITSWIYDSEYFKPLVDNQSLDDDDTYGFSVRVYQDLLKTNELGPTDRQGIEYVANIVPLPLPDTKLGWWPTITVPGFNSATVWVAAVGDALGQISAKEDAIWHPPQRPVTGPKFRVYRFNPAGTPNGRPTAVASSERPGHEARRAFDGTVEFWEAAAMGPAAAGQFIGFDFGDRGAKGVAQVRVQWTDASATPAAIRVEYSDDGDSWTAASRFEVAPYLAGAAGHRIDTFRLQHRAPHRFWRIVADQIPEDFKFRISELYFDRTAKADLR
jgi:hypothetical protein